MTIENVLKQFKDKRIMLIGDTIIDHYIDGNTTKISPDAPVPLLDIIFEKYKIGSFAKVIKYIQNFGGKLELISRIGDDMEGQLFFTEMESFNLDLSGIFQVGKVTPKITRIYSQGNQMLRIEKQEKLKRDEIYKLNKLIENHLKDRIENCDVILLLDYDLGLLNPILITQLLAIAKEFNKKIIVRPESQKYIYYHDTYLLVMNRRIASIATSINPINETSIRIMGNKLLNELHSEGIFIPWIEEDSYLFVNDNVTIYPSLLKTHEKKYSNVGSATSAILALMTACNEPIEKSIEVAHYAGSLAATHENNYFFNQETLKEVINNRQISNL